MKMRKNKYILIGIALFTLLLTFSFVFSSEAEAASKKTYTINANSEPIDKSMKKFSTYNSKTKQYYTLRSYLERLEKEKGGKLILKKGTYTITNTLYVPSNVTIEFQNGVKIVKGTSTGTSKMKPAKSVFQLIRPSKANKKGVYGKYAGEKNIKFIGKGTVTFDLKHYKSSIAIIMGHNQNVEVNNIDFKNMYEGHFIELDASKNVKIINSSFKNAKHTSANKEGINIDAPDRSTKGWSQEWSKYDKQPNDTVLIENNVFDGLDRAIGTHKYSDKKMHNNIVIKKNKILNMKSDSIRVMNWSNPIIENNTFTLKKGATKSSNIRGILVSGVTNPTFQKNTFTNIPRAMQFIVWKNTGGGSEKPIFSTLSAKNKKALQNNTVINAQENFVRITNKAYLDYSNAEKINLKVSK